MIKIDIQSSEPVQIRINGVWTDDQARRETITLDREYEILGPSEPSKWGDSFYYTDQPDHGATKCSSTVGYTSAEMATKTLRFIRPLTKK